MNRAAVIAAGAAVAVVLGFVVWSPADGAAPVPAQSTLERLEQRIRNRNEQSASAADKTAEVSTSATTMEKSAKGPAEGPGYVGIIADDAKDRGRVAEVVPALPAADRRFCCRTAGHRSTLGQDLVEQFPRRLPSRWWARPRMADSSSDSSDRRGR